MVEVGFLADFANNYIFLNIKCQGHVILKKYNQANFLIFISRQHYDKCSDEVPHSKPDTGATFC